MVVDPSKETIGRWYISMPQPRVRAQDTHIIFLQIMTLTLWGPGHVEDKIYSHGRLYLTTHIQVKNTISITLVEEQIRDILT